MLLRCVRKRTHGKGLRSYKLWGTDELGPLYLPSVEGVSFYRSDSLRALKLYVPRLEELNLRAAYAISSLTLLDRGKDEHEHLLHTESGRPMNLPKRKHSKFTLNMINGCASRDFRVKWANDPRLKKVIWKCADDGFPIGYFSDSEDEQFDRENNVSEDVNNQVPIPLEDVTVDGLSEKERRNRARWIRNADEAEDNCTIM